MRKERDPINLLTAYALDGNLVTEDELKVELLLCCVSGSDQAEEEGRHAGHFVEWLFSSWRLLPIKHLFWCIEKCVCRDGIPFLEVPLLEVPL